MDLETRIEKMLKECGEEGYVPSYFINMRSELGTKDSMIRLVSDPTISKGLMKLFELERLDLSLECICLEPDWDSIFDDKLRSIARKKLNDLNCMSCPNL